MVDTEVCSLSEIQSSDTGWSCRREIGRWKLTQPSIWSLRPNHIYQGIWVQKRLKFQRDKFVTKAWWSFKDGWDFTLNLFSRPPLLVFLSAENITSKVGKQSKWTKSKTKVTQWNATQCTLMENKQVHTSLTFIVEFSELFTKLLHWYRT